MEYKLDHYRLDYEYKITQRLNEIFNKQTLEELDKVIKFFIDIIIKLLKNESRDDAYILIFLKTYMFNGNVQDYGYIKIPSLLESHKV